jgi:hypothetical protein
MKKIKMATKKKAQLTFFIIRKFKKKFTKKIKLIVFPTRKLKFKLKLLVIRKKNFNFKVYATIISNLFQNKNLKFKKKSSV